MSIKVFDVEGKKLPGHDADIQDFVLATGATFPSGTAQQFVKDEKQILAATKLPERLSDGVKSSISSVARTTNASLQAAGSGSAKAGFFGHHFSHPLSDSYHSQAPIRFGDHVAKIAAFPTSPATRGLIGQEIDVKRDPDGFRTAAVTFFRGNDAIFELRAQLWTNAETQPIDDTSVEWPEDESAYVTVATLRLPRQDAYSEERQRYFDDVLTFQTGHALAAHRPLGSLMRARLRVYEALSSFRQSRNGVPRDTTADPARIPA